MLDKGSYENGQRTYTISGWAEDSETAGFNSDYVLRLSIPGYQTDLPELFFYVDGFSGDINLCDPEFPLLVGPDQQFNPVPGLGLLSNSESDSSLAPPDLGIDLSNFTTPGGRVYLTEEEADQGFGEHALNVARSENA